MTPDMTAFSSPYRPTGLYKVPETFHTGVSMVDGKGRAVGASTNIPQKMTKMCEALYRLRFSRLPLIR